MPSSLYYYDLQVIPARKIFDTPRKPLARSLPLEGGGRNATDLGGRPQQRQEAVGRLSPMAFLVGVSLPQTPPPDAPNELAPQGSCAERWAQVGGANSWRVFLPPRHAEGMPSA